MPTIESSDGQRWVPAKEYKPSMTGTDKLALGLILTIFVVCLLFLGLIGLGFVEIIQWLVSK